MDTRRPWLDDPFPDYDIEPVLNQPSRFACYGGQEYAHG